MWKVLKVLFTGIAVSFYFFPFEFTFLPGVNTKMAMAGMSLFILAYDMAGRRSGTSNKDFLSVLVYSIAISLCGLFSVVVNATSDYTYATYVVSMCVWMGGAYTVIYLIKKNHSQISITILGHYLIAVCVAQCVIALIMVFSPAIKSFVDSFLASEGFMGKVEGRMYGVGAALDVAGTRFAAILVLIACFCRRGELSSRKMILYIFAYLCVLLIGSMIARTTVIGGVLGFLLLLVSPRGNNSKLWKYFILITCVSVLIVVHFYNSNEVFYHNVRFAFEGFFSLVETGRWETKSNNILANMFIFPDNIKTWLIGDGYFDNPIFTDKYYVGDNFTGFYKDTDVGYCRFIFYFGLLGLTAFIFFFIRVYAICAKRFADFRNMFILFLLLNFIIWIKVSTDLFLLFALFLCLSKDDNDAYENSLSDPLDI